jgi:hypothetical protein
MATIVTLKLGGKALAETTTWDRFASACVECQVWQNPEWPEHVETQAVELAESYGFELFTWSFKEGLHGRERVRKFARRPQSFWIQFAEELGFQWKEV